jgi:hypothetical protein
VVSRTEPERARGLRASWSRIIDRLEAGEAKAALLQVLVDLDEHWDKEHPEDGLPEDLGIEPEEYLTTLIERVRRAPRSFDG